MDILRKFVRVENDAQLGERQIRIIASDATVDRANDVMVPEGCDLSDYKLNPIILAQHDPAHPIAKAMVEIVNGRVEALIEFPPRGVSAKADEYCGLAKAGIINAASVGFEGVEADPIKGGGLRYNKWKLLEISLVSVPCNPSALVIARAAPARTKADAEWKVGASRNLTIDEDESWDGPEAEASIFAHCNFDGDKPDTNFARKGFLVYDASAPELKGSYKLPFAKVKDGRLVALKSGIRAAASRLPQTDIPDAAATKARAVIDHYESKFSDGDGKGASSMKVKSAKIAKLTAAITTKGMYGVAQLASMLQDLGWVVNSSAWEAEMEGDGSKVPAMLADGLRVLADAFVAMSVEEVGELLAAVTPASDKAARNVAMKKLFGRARKAVKAGRRFSQANQDHLDAIDKCTKAMDACREKMADLHDDAVGHTEEMKGHLDEIDGHIKALKGTKSADAGEHVDAMSKCTDKMGNCCQKMAHLHDYLHDHIEELQQHIEEAGEHLKAMRGDDESDDDGRDDEDDSGDDGDDPENSDGELAFEIEQRKRTLALLTR